MVRAAWQKTGVQFVLIAFLALAVRLLVFWGTINQSIEGDEVDYFVIAQKIIQVPPPDTSPFLPAQNENGPRNIRVPAAGCFYAALFDIFGVSVSIAKLGNIVLSVVFLLPMFYLGKLHHGVKTGIFAVLLTAIFPELLGYSVMLFSENIYIFLAGSGLMLFLLYLRSSRTWALLASGVLFGFSALARPVGLIFPFLAAGALIFKSRFTFLKSLLLSISFAATVVLAILPWTIYINRYTGRFVLLADDFVFPAFKGEAQDLKFEAPFKSYKEKYQSFGETKTERDLVATQWLIHRIASEMPWWPMKKIIAQVPHFFTPDSESEQRIIIFLNKEKEHGTIGRAPIVKVGLIICSVVIVLATVALFIIGSVGFVLPKLSKPSIFLLLFVLAHLLPCVITHATSRYRLPIIAPFIVSVAAFFTSCRQDWAEASRRRRWVAGAAGIFMIGIICINFLNPLPEPSIVGLIHQLLGSFKIPVYFPGG